MTVVPMRFPTDGTGRKEGYAINGGRTEAIAIGESGLPPGWSTTRRGSEDEPNANLLVACCRQGG